MYMIYKKLPLLFIIAFSFFTVFNQEKSPATINGIIKDARTKLPLAEAVITASSNAFIGHRFAITDSAGMYTINSLPAGIYAITFEMEGYEKFMQQNIDLKEGMSIGVSFDMIKERKHKNKEIPPQIP